MFLSLATVSLVSTMRMLSHSTPTTVLRRALVDSHPSLSKVAGLSHRQIFSRLLTLSKRKTLLTIEDILRELSIKTMVILRDKTSPRVIPVPLFQQATTSLSAKSLLRPTSSN